MLTGELPESPGSAMMEVQMEQLAINWAPKRQSFTVSELNDRIRELLDGEFGWIWVSGEISGLRAPSSGHLYFSLKDRESQIKAVVYRSALARLRVKPKDGLEVLARGRLDVYGARGEYQLIVEVIEIQGAGALQLEFERLKQRLELEGLFARERKKPLPKFPRRIGIITSPTGAVIRDFLHVLERRFPGLEVRLFPALVQGEGSVEDVVRGLRYFAETPWAEVVVVARGGGSLEDLWTFNTEPVARAIAASPVPVVSAIGHETDFTISDFVADLRAPTPSAAAEMIVPVREDLIAAVEGCRRALCKVVQYQLADLFRRLESRGTARASYVLLRRIRQAQQRLDEQGLLLSEATSIRIARLETRLHDVSGRLQQSDIRLRLQRSETRLAELTGRLSRAKVRLLEERRRTLANVEDRSAAALQARLQRAQRSLERVEPRLYSLSPKAVLERGYAIVRKQDGRVVREPEEVLRGESLEVLVRGGSFPVKRH